MHVENEDSELVSFCAQELMHFRRLYVACLTLKLEK